VTDKLESIWKEAIIAYSRNHPDILKDELKPTIKTSYFLVITQPVMVIPHRHFGNGSIFKESLEEGTDRLFRNVGL
jgi:hypothetical protein